MGIYNEKYHLVIHLVIEDLFEVLTSRIALGSSSNTNLGKISCGGSNSLSTNSVGAVALDAKSTLRNGDPSGDVRATAPLEFDIAPAKTDAFISDNLQDEFAIDIISHKRPVELMRGIAEWTIGVASSFSWLRRSHICAFPSWRAEGSARIIFSRMIDSLYGSQYGSGASLNFS